MQMKYKNKKKNQNKNKKEKTKNEKTKRGRLCTFGVANSQSINLGDPLRGVYISTIFIENLNTL